MGYGNAQEYGKTLLDAMAAVGRYKENLGAVTLSETEPLPAKAGRFGVLLKQPKACTLKVIFFSLLLNLSQSYQSYSFPVGLDSEYTL